MSSYRLNVSENLNQTVPSTTPYNFANAPFQNWSVIFNTANLGGQNYQALVLEATHRLAAGDSPTRRTMPGLTTSAMPRATRLLHFRGRPAMGLRT